MNAMSLARTATVHHDEGVVTRRSTDGCCVCLPRPVTANHELGILAVLWNVWTAARSDTRGADVEWTVDVCEFDKPTLPLVAILSAIDADLRQAGRKLLVVRGPHMPSLAISELLPRT